MKTYLEYKDIRGMEDAATNFRDKLLIRLLFHLGCRISEALALIAENVDFTNGLVTIIHLKSRSKLICPHCEARLSRSSSYCPRCGIKIDKAKLQEQEHRKFRTVPIDYETLTILKDYIDQGGPILKNGKKYIFGINRHRAWQIVKQCAERAGLPSLVNPDTGKARGVSPHRLRDAFAVHAMKSDDSGDGLRLLQEHLGHASFDTTAKYRKIAGEEHREWYQKLWKQERS
jgi:integrase/recombinase XerD